MGRDGFGKGQDTVKIRYMQLSFKIGIPNVKWDSLDNYQELIGIYCP